MSSIGLFSLYYFSERFIVNVKKQLLIVHIYIRTCNECTSHEYVYRRNNKITIIWRIRKTVDLVEMSCCQPPEERSFHISFSLFLFPLYFSFIYLLFFFFDIIMRESFCSVPRYSIPAVGHVRAHCSCYGTVRFSYGKIYTSKLNFFFPCSRVHIIYRAITQHAHHHFVH